MPGYQTCYKLNIQATLQTLSCVFNNVNVKNIPKSSRIYFNMKILHKHNGYLLWDSPVNIPEHLVSLSLL